MLSDRNLNLQKRIPAAFNNELEEEKLPPGRPCGSLSGKQ